MLIKPIYELLPYSYMIVGTASIFLLEPSYALAASIVVYLYGAHIYNLRSKNRRTDPKRKRKAGALPETLYGLMPFIYVFSALSLYRFYPKDSSTLFALCLATYGAYLFMRRSSYRHHKYPKGIRQ
ncbi:hypothetical protein K8B83_18065 [Shewanella inventionis]|uniref:Uncharacterized protein n=1 Tax=Shewanella inventionis TaxID=1738770 RepID=A0ABQ1J717_9GAMM|nr:hypothetical protein [Shewanella inventionis]MCL1157891.1 hypothetical protein [Shewanella inventionis]UAL42707.1 hypothetical protein K8B83_18065 [Shewanella inventionis]GGB59965.1 hypothetical protein GCM10011607_20760 [Shewanella inventionis]